MFFLCFNYYDQKVENISPPILIQKVKIIVKNIIYYFKLVYVVNTSLNLNLSSTLFAGLCPWLIV